MTTLREQVDKANSEGITERQFIHTLTPRLQEQGWWGKQIIVDGDGNAEQVQLGSPSRLATIYRTNVATAYQAGRYQQQLASTDTHPYWQYIAVMDGRTRKSHATMHGRVFRFDDPIWDKLYPPNDWGCRCRVRALTAEQVKRMGLTVESSTGSVSSQQVATGVDKRTGEVYEAETTTFKRGSQTMTTGAGWSNNAGQLAMGADVSLARKLLELQNRELRQQVIQSLNNAPVRQHAFAHWVGQVMTSRQASKGQQSPGFVTDGIALAIEQRLGQSAPRVLTVNETTLKPGLAMAEYQSLPAIIGQPAAVMLDKDSRQLLYISAAEREAGRTVVTVPVQHSPVEHLTGGAVQVDAIPLATLRTGLQNGRYELLEGTL
ncbi:phage head morphogenesis protein [Xenorhabdus nematophila]|uniref:phage head morphogenesis protein n=1 Tax=Xenorhabdus nematophila TaxID=628 RepID=UPI001E117DB4|nr:phage minor head protein [Xenorhabdus nematophila]MCB4425588.1 phage head morphogenesis protein [Xenorhabdus nematophila]